MRVTHTATTAPIGETEWLADHALEGFVADDDARLSDARTPTEHTHNYADLDHLHPHSHVEYADTVHTHSYADASHTHTLEQHSHPLESHSHDTTHAHTAAEVGASAAGHDHAGVYAAPHAHPYAATSHGTHLSLGTSAGTAAEGNHAHAGGGANVKSGTVNLGAGGTANVSFTTPFSSTPQVVVSSAFNGSDTSTTLFAHSVTVNGFTLKGAGNAAGIVAWIATDAGNV